MSNPIAHRPPLGLLESFGFPVATPEGRRDLLVGGTVLMLMLPIGWVLNMGHRLDVVYRIYHDDPPYYRGFRPWMTTFLRGLKALMAILIYLSPALLCVLGVEQGVGWLAVPGGLFFVVAIYILPGGMTYNAAFNDIRYLYRPDHALRRALEGGRAYLWAWGIALLAISLSFLGLLAVGIGFFYTSVWAWMVVGYAFSRALSLSHGSSP
jgi:hypothetical protein